MLISDFIKDANVLDKLGSNLPIPYIENVHINDESLDIYLSVYLHVPERYYKQNDETSINVYITSTYDNIEFNVVSLIDRNADNNAYGITPWKDEMSNVQYFGTKGWTNVSNNIDSVLKYVTGVDPDEQVLITTNFRLPDLIATQEESAFTNLEVAFSDETISFDNYTLPNGNSAIWTNYETYKSDSLNAGIYETESEAIIKILNDLILQAVAANDNVLIPELFSVKTYCVTDENDAFTVEDGTYFPSVEITKVRIQPILNTSSLSDSDWTRSDTLENSDGSAYIKYTKNFNIGTSVITHFIYGLEADAGVKVEKLGLAAFSGPKGILSDGVQRAEINQNYARNSGVNKLWENSISEVNNILLIRNNGINFDPVDVYIDDNGVFYDNVMQSIDGNYYEVSAATPDDILKDMQAIDATGVTDGTYNAFQYLLATAMMEPIQLIPKMNLFRRSYPDKSTATPEGLFYDRFAEILFNANTLVERGMRLTRTLKNNPIIKDLRTSITRVDPTLNSVWELDREDREAIYYDLFSLDNALWSRYTEVTGKESDIADNTTTEVRDDISGDYDYTTYVIDGGQWNYNFIDHGFMFFNYEKALRTTSFISRFIDTISFEKYFGQKILNNLFEMTKVRLRTAYAENDPHTGTFGDGDDNPRAVLQGQMTADIDVTNPNFTVQYVTRNEAGVYGLSTIAQETGGDNTLFNENKFSIFVDNNVSNATLENGYIESSEGVRISNEYGGADAMVNDREYSFIAMRGFCPISNTPEAAPFVMDQQFLVTNDINYRLACFEFQKCDYWDAQEFSNYGLSIAPDGSLQQIGQLSTGICFTATLVVEDHTAKILGYLHTLIEDVYDNYLDYLAAAEDTCSFNDGSNTFNEYFVETVRANWPNTWESPAYRAVSLGIILEDMFYKTFDADEIGITSHIKQVYLSVCPETGTLEGVRNFKTRLEAIHTKINNVYNVYGDDESVGHVYGHGAQRFTGTSGAVNASNQLETSATLAFTAYESSVPLQGQEDVALHQGAWFPEGTYDNYPKFPTIATNIDSYSEEDLSDIDFDLDTDGSGVVEVDECFVAGTLIKVFRDTKIVDVPIEQITTNDVVLSYNFIEQCVEHKPVVNTTRTMHQNIVEFVFDNGTKTQHSFDHPYYVFGKGWTSYSPESTQEKYSEKSPVLSNVSQIEIGDHCQLYDNTRTRLVRINVVEQLEAIQTYNLHVEQNNTYYADGILVHNKTVAGGSPFSPGFDPYDFEILGKFGDERGTMEGAGGSDPTDDDPDFDTPASTEGDGSGDGFGGSGF